MRTLIRSVYITALSAVLLLLTAQGINAATFTVSTTGDNGPGSLREAVGTANATAGDDTIVFAIPAASCPLGVCTITLTSGQLTVSPVGALTITNSTGAANLLISGNNSSRVIYVDRDANFTLNGVTITNGSADFGGGIRAYINSTLTVTNSVVSGNHASSLGGGINTYRCDLTVTNSTISGNSAGTGGGLALNSATTMTNSTVSGNTANWGGAIHNYEFNLTLASVTVAFNSAATTGGIVNQSAGAYISNTLVAQNAGGNYEGGINSNTFNLFSDGSMLDPVLAFNGGTTPNHALLPGSPAIDQGNATGTDQRGFARPVDDAAIINAAGGNGADIGAFEVQPPPPPPIVTPTSTEQCKNGGWTTFTSPRTFRNQGDCVRFVASGL
jgi:hypothetical protein